MWCHTSSQSLTWTAEQSPRSSRGLDPRRWTSEALNAGKTPPQTAWSEAKTHIHQHTDIAKVGKWDYLLDVCSVDVLKKIWCFCGVNTKRTGLVHGRTCSQSVGGVFLIMGGKERVNKLDICRKTIERDIAKILPKRKKVMNKSVRSLRSGKS